ncbi:hypothetical protein Droror1_Dr00006031 [Drosera rotundifolia]
MTRLHICLIYCTVKFVGFANFVGFSCLSGSDVFTAKPTRTGVVVDDTPSSLSYVQGFNMSRHSLERNRDWDRQQYKFYAVCTVEVLNYRIAFFTNLFQRLISSNGRNQLQHMCCIFLQLAILLRESGI